MRKLSIFFVILSAFFASSVFAAPFTDNGNGTVTDIKTGLVWQQGEPGYMTWGSAFILRRAFPWRHDRLAAAEYKRA